MSEVFGEVLGVNVYATATTYTVVRDGITPGWYTFTASQTQVYVRPYKADSSWEYARDGIMIDRGASRSFYIAGGEYSYYIPAGGTLRVERVRPVNPYSAPKRS